MVGLIAIGDLLPAVLAKAFAHAQHDQGHPSDGENNESGASHAAGSEGVAAGNIVGTPAARAGGEAAPRETGMNRRAQTNAPSLRRDGTGAALTPRPASGLPQARTVSGHQPVACRLPAGRR